MLDRVAQIPGLKAAGVISLVPIREWGSNGEVQIAGQPTPPPNEVTLAEDRFVSPGYFDVMGIRLLKGRMLSPGLDRQENNAASVLVNQAFVKKFIPGNLDPVGQQLQSGDKEIPNMPIVGETTSVRQSLMESPMPEQDFLASQLPAKYGMMLMTSNLVVRSDGDPRLLIPSLREVFHQVDPTLPFREPLTMREIVADQLVMQRMESWLFGIFASLAVLLAVVGLYGLISHEVETGTRDIGIRMAFGASREEVFALILRRVAVLLTAGVVVGLALTFTAKQLIASVVTVSFVHQAGLMALLVVLLAATGLMAAYLPMRRAAAIEPMEALRTE
jgi:hypothetical protein